MAVISAVRFRLVAHGGSCGESGVRQVSRPMSLATSDSPQLFREAVGPDFSAERRLLDRGAEFVCGVDEAGRGPLAGPVVAAAVILDPEEIPDGLNDSKKLTEARRVALFEKLMRTCVFSLASVDAATIDKINVRAASLRAMTQAVSGLEKKPDHVLIDGNATPPDMPCESTALVKGDSRSVSIAAASIIAKVMRDRMMERAGVQYPDYGFGKHKGYGTKVHLDAIRSVGPCPLHRVTFAPVRDAKRIKKPGP